MSEFIPIIMAGGAGTRFWPVSTEERPKQFQTLVGGRSLIQESFERLRAICPSERIMVLTHQKYVAEVARQLPEIPAANIVGEPERRDTAAAVALAALLGQHRFGDAVMLMLTADHWIQPLENFHQAVREMVAGAAHPGTIYTMGITPSYPATGYGYLKLGARIEDPAFALNHYHLDTFREKPDLATASAYLKDGGYLWNSGMFAWTFQTILDAFQQHLPGHLETLRPTLDGQVSLAEAFPRLQKISVDFAILEKAADIRCVQPQFEWSDLGGWLALEPFLDSHPDKNLSRGQLNLLDSHNNLVFCEDDQERVALIGVDDLIVVRAGKTTLVLPRERSEDVKKLLERYPQ